MRVSRRPIRVSTSSSTPSRQAGCGRTLSDIASGASSLRPGLTELLDISYTPATTLKMHASTRGSPSESRSKRDEVLIREPTERGLRRLAHEHVRGRRMEHDDGSAALAHAHRPQAVARASTEVCR